MGLTDDQRQRAAQRIIDDPLINEAWDLIEKEIMLSWKHSSDHDIESREHLWLTLKNLNRLKLHFESIVTTGKMNSKI